MKLFKTTIVIWSDSDPNGADIDQLAANAVNGDSYCSKRKTVTVSNPGSDPDWDGTEFFGINEDCEVLVKSIYFEKGVI